MNTVIYFCAVYCIIIASLYAVLHVLMKHEKKHHVLHIVTILGSAVVAWVVARILKSDIAHARPDLTHAMFLPSDPYSFPSGHATFMFALAFAMYSFDKRAALLLFAFAVITGVARVLAGVHFWYDIVAGAILALLVAKSIFYLSKKFIKKA